MLLLTLISFLVVPAAIAADDKPTIALIKWGDLNTVALAEKGVLDMLEAHGYINEDERNRLNQGHSLRRRKHQIHLW